MRDERLERLRFMIKKLMTEVQEGRIVNQWDKKFIISSNNRIRYNATISTAREKVIERLFEVY